LTRTLSPVTEKLPVHMLFTSNIPKHIEPWSWVFWAYMELKFQSCLVKLTNAKLEVNAENQHQNMHEKPKAL
jgi:hypothetical protein